MLTRLTTRRAGFTLLEFGITLAVIALLAAIAIPVGIAIDRRAADGKLASDMTAFLRSAEAYATYTEGRITTETLEASLDPRLGWRLLPPGASVTEPQRLAVVADGDTVSLTSRSRSGRCVTYHGATRESRVFDPTDGGSCVPTNAAGDTAGGVSLAGPALYTPLVAAGGDGFSAVLTADGAVVTSGLNSTGQLGLGDTASRAAFTAVAPAVTAAPQVQPSSGGPDFDPSGYANGETPGATLGVLGPMVDGGQTGQLAAGTRHLLILDRDGELWGAGDNADGQLGRDHWVFNPSSGEYEQVAIGAAADRPVLLRKHVAAVAAGDRHTVIIDRDGLMWTTGVNFVGQLGLGHTLPVDDFTLVHATDTYECVVAGANHTLAIRNHPSSPRCVGSTLVGFGMNSDNQLARPGTSANATSPVEIPKPAAWSGPHLWAFPTAGATHSAVSAWLPGSPAPVGVYVAGSNRSGQIGINATGSGQQWRELLPLTEYAAASAGRNHTLVLRGSGPATLWGTGSNSSGQLGTSSPTSVSVLTRLEVGADEPRLVDPRGVVAVWDATFLLGSPALEGHSQGFAAGSNTHGGLGLGTLGPVQRFTPLP